MGHYIMNFTVYTLAMSGLICFALFVYKKVMSGSFSSKASKFLEIEETMSVNPRKSLMVVRAGAERFLIASDMDRTSLISKLENGKTNNSKFVDKPYFTSVENENLDTIYPKKEVHLELINSNNPQSPRLRRKNISKGMSTGKMVNLDVNKSVEHGFSTMKEMAMKINEL